MAKIRSIHPDATESHTLARLTPQAERTFWRLLPHTDDAGRGKYDPLVLRSKLYSAVESMTTAQVEKDFAELVKVGVVTLYEHRGKCYYHVTSWDEYQKPKYKAESRIVAPDAPDVAPVEPRPSPRRGKVAPPSPPDVPHGVGVGVGVGEGGVDATASTRTPEQRFAEFWKIYPPNSGNGKPGGGAPRKESLRLFCKLEPDEQEAALLGARNYAEDSKRPDAPFPANATTWLNQRRWEDWQTPGLRVVGNLSADGKRANTPW